MELKEPDNIVPEFEIVSGIHSMELKDTVTQPCLQLPAVSRIHSMELKGSIAPSLKKFADSNPFNGIERSS